MRGRVVPFDRSTTCRRTLPGVTIADS
jgi:hypothetical protein